MATSPPAPAASQRLEPALLRLAGIVLLGAIAAQLDSTIVTVAIDTLGRDLHSSVTTMQWVGTAYLLALAIVLPISGWSVERFGAKRMWMISLSLFLGGSVLCGLAWSSGSLIAFRVLQGLGGGLLIPLMQTILAQAAGPKRLQRLMGVIAVPAMLAPVLGPVIGGVILDNASWRWIFFVNVPVVGLALLAAWRGMPELPGSGERRLDVLGLALLSPGLAGIVFGFSRAGSQGGFGAPEVIVALALGIVLLLAFGWHALHSRIEPLIDLRLFRARSFAASSALMFLVGAALFGAMLLLPLYYQQARGQSALDAGLLLAPQGLGLMIALIVVSRAGDHFGPRATVLAGVVLTLLGTLAYTQVTPHTSELLLGVSLVVRGAGLGAAFVPVIAASYIGLRVDQIPRATTAVRIFQQVGGSLGTAIFAVILQRETVRHGAGGAFGPTFWWAMGLTALAFIPAALLPRRANGD